MIYDTGWGSYDLMNFAIYDVINMTDNKYCLYRKCFLIGEMKAFQIKKDSWRTKCIGNILFLRCKISDDVKYLTEDIDTGIWGPSSKRTHDELIEYYISTS